MEQIYCLTFIIIFIIILIIINVYYYKRQEQFNNHCNTINELDIYGFTEYTDNKQLILNIYYNIESYINYITTKVKHNKSI